MKENLSKLETTHMRAHHLLMVKKNEQINNKKKENLVTKRR